MNKKYLEGVKEPHKVKIFKTFSSELKVVDDVKRILVVTISTPNADRSKDTVQPSGMEYKNFLENPVVLFAHQYDTKPIAKCTGLKVNENGVMATVEFLPEGVYQEADIIYTMYKNGFLNAWSIGFMPLEDGYEENEEGGYNFKKWELFEFSSVPVPDNPEALTIMRSKGISDEQINLVISKSKEKSEEKKTEENKEAPKEEKKEEIKLEVKAENPKEESKENEVKTIEAEKIEVKKKKKEKPSEKVKRLEAKIEVLKKELETKDADNPDDPGYDGKTKITELDVDQLKNLMDEVLDAEEEENEGESDQTKDDGKAVAEAVKKDVNQVVALGYLLDELSYFIWYFTESEVSQPSIDKLSQALSLVMDVVKEQATLGQKEVSIPPLQFTKDGKLIFEKSGRTISGANEERLKSACDHMGQATEHVKSVLSSVDEAQASSNAQDDNMNSNTVIPNSDEGKSAQPTLLQRLATQTNKTQKQMAKADKEVGLTLRLLKQIKTMKGGEK